MLITVYDSETSSLDKSNCTVMELGWAVYNVTPSPIKDLWRCIKAKSSLVRWNKNYAVDPEAFAVTGLDAKQCEAFGTHAADLFNEFLEDAKNSDYIAGHNVKDFDSEVVLNNIFRALSPDDLSTFDAYKNTWETYQQIDSLHDIDYPSTQRTKSLKYVALDHNYVLMGAHEALADVFASAHLFSSYSIEGIIEHSKIPMITVQLKTVWGENVDDIRKAKFAWDRVGKFWHKKIKAHKLELLKSLLPGRNLILTSPLTQTKQMELPEQIPF